MAFVKLNGSVFLDLDGCLIFHNYTPFETEDVLLPYALEFLKLLKEKNYYCILTTARSKEECDYIISVLRKESFVFDKLIFNLPPVKRILINDNKGDEVRAVAYPVERNGGCEELINEFL